MTCLRFGNARTRARDGRNRARRDTVWLSFSNKHPFHRIVLIFGSGDAWNHEAVTGVESAWGPGERGCRSWDQLLRLGAGFSSARTTLKPCSWPISASSA